ncbi:MAG: acetyl-CoA carboxylase biotin carboxyl carrier protein [Bacteroidales bacterium]
MKEYKITINGNDYNVAIKETDGYISDVEVNGDNYHVEIERPVATVKTPKLVQVANIPSTDSHQAIAKTVPPGASDAVKSPLPGVVLEILVKEGDTIAVGQKLMVLEAMKMENSIESTCVGKVLAIKVRQGESVLEGAELLSIG